MAVDLWRGASNNYGLNDFIEKQEKLRAFREEQDAKKKDRERAEMTRRGLASIMSETERPVTTIRRELNPEYDAYASAGGDPEVYGLKKYAETSETTKQPVPQADRFAKAGEFLLSQGDVKSFGALEDVTAKLNANQLKSIQAVMKFAPMLQSPQARIALSQQMGIDPKILDSVKQVQPGVYTIPDGAGGNIVYATTPTGETKVFHSKPSGMNPELKKRELDIKQQMADQGKKRLDQGWSRLDPALQAELERAKKVAGAQGKGAVAAVEKAQQATFTLQRMNELEAKINDPDMQWGLAGEISTKLGTLSPEFSKLFRTGRMEELLVASPDLMLDMKKLLGPQISNSDAAMMLQFTGGDFRSKARVQSAIERIRAMAANDIEVGRSMTQNVATPSARRMIQTPQAGNAPQKATTTPMSKEAVRATVAQEASSMRPGETRRATFNGRPAKISKRPDGSVAVQFE